MADPGENQQPEQVCNFFRKPSRNNNIRKRTVVEDEEEDSKMETSFSHTDKKTLKPEIKLHFSTGSSTHIHQRLLKRKRNLRPIFQFESSKEIQVEHDSRATATLETETEFSRDARALREKALKQADEALKGKGKSSGMKSFITGSMGILIIRLGFEESKQLPTRKMVGAHGPFEEFQHDLIISRTYVRITKRLLETMQRKNTSKSV